MKQQTEQQQTIQQLVARADYLADRADRAFRRYMEGEVRTASGAARLRNQADEAYADVRLHPDYDEERFYASHLFYA